MTHIFRQRLRHLVMTTGLLMLLVPMTASVAWAQDDETSERPALPPSQYPAEVLDPPPMPKLPKGDWTSKPSVFNDALATEDADGNDLDKLFDLSGTTWSAHIDVPKATGPQEAEDENDPLSQALEPFMEALSKKYYDYRIQLGDSPYYVVGAADDGEDSDVSGLSVAAQGKLRFIAVTEHADGDLEIFVSDAVPVGDFLQKISGKKETPEPKK